MTITDEGKRLRIEAARLRSDRRRRYPGELRHRLLDWVDRAQAEGLSEADCGRLVGIKTWRFRCWREAPDGAEAKEDRKALSLVPIAVRSAGAATGLSLIAPSGHRVEQTLKMLEELKEQAKAAQAAAQRARAEQKKRSQERKRKHGNGRQTGPTPQPLLPMVERVFTLDDADRAGPSCGGELRPMSGQFEESELIDLIDVRYELVRVKQQKYRAGRRRAPDSRRQERRDLRRTRRHLRWHDRMRRARHPRRRRARRSGHHAGRLLGARLRKFEEAMADHPDAEQALASIGALYEIDRRADGDAARLAELRRTESTTVLAAMKPWLWERAANAAISIGKAAAYTLANWDRLTRFVEDARVPLDNNATERIRGPVVGRKNQYGSKSRRGTEVAATLSTVLETAKLHGIDPSAYLAAALAAADRGGALMPWEFAPSSAAAV